MIIEHNAGTFCITPCDDGIEFSLTTKKGLWFKTMASTVGGKQAPMLENVNKLAAYVRKYQGEFLGLRTLIDMTHLARS